MRFDLRDLAPGDRYKLLTGVVVPRPIAWVTTLGEHGHVNAAPFSYFAALGSDPPIVALGIGDARPGTPKDTGANIRRSGEFVIQLVTADLAEAMNVTATEFPPDESEVEAAGLALEPSVLIAPPRLAASPVHLECREVTTLLVGRTRVVLGEVLMLHIRDDLMLDPAKFYVNTPALGAVGRMGGRGGYTRTTDLFELPRLTYAAWQQGRQEQERAAPEDGARRS